MRGRCTGNTIVLFPAALLVLLAMVTITVDAAVVHLGQRRLSDMAGAMANDAVAALDIDQYYASGEVRFDADRAARRLSYIDEGFAEDRDLHDVRCAITLVGERVTVSCEGRVRPVFARLWENVSNRVTVTASETVRAAEQ